MSSKNEKNQTINNILLSGGAKGGDMLWDTVAEMLSHDRIHFSYSGANFKSKREHTYILSNTELSVADNFLEEANLTLQRKFPTGSYHVNSLLRRNYYQIRDSERLYAVTRVRQSTCEGGTAWAVQMFIDKHETNSCECYVFCTDKLSWYKWDGFLFSLIDVPPKPHGVWTGIGSRELTSEVKAIIINQAKEWQCSNILI